MRRTDQDTRTPAMREMRRPKRVTLVIAHLGAGGAQRVAATAANALVELGIEVHLIKVFNDPADAYAVDPRVHRYSLGAPLRAPKRRKRRFFQRGLRFVCQRGAEFRGLPARADG